MSEAAAPRSAAEVTAGWLTRVLREARALPDGVVTSFESEPVGQGAGFVGQLVRLRPSYDGPAGPQSLIAKFPSANPEIRAGMTADRLYQRETLFYLELAGRAGIGVPHCYCSLFDEETGDHVLLLEDIVGSSGDNLRGCSPQDARQAIVALARLHARWWESPDLEALTWLPSADATEAGEGYRDLWPVFLGRIGRHISADVRTAGERLLTSLDDVRGRLAQSPRTLVHGDYRLDNLLFRADAGVTVIDWQVAVKGRGPLDVAYFAVLCLQPDQRRAMEMDLLHLYHAEVLSAGVVNYQFEHCLEDYRLAIAQCLIRMVEAGAVLDFSSRRGRALSLAVAQRVSAALVDHDVAGLLPSPY